MAKVRIDFPITTEVGLFNYVKSRFGVSIPYQKCCDIHPTSPWQAFADAYFARGTMHLWKASRGFGGKSFLLSLYGATCADTLAAEVKILGGSGAQSKRVKEHMGTFWSAPSFPKSRLEQNTTVKAELINGGSVEALMASQTSARGPHPQRLLLDEVDEMDLAIIDASMGQTMGKDMRYGFVPKATVMASTKQYANGPMAEMERRVKRGGWKYHEWCYRAGLKSRGFWLSDDEVASKKLEITEIMWDTEYEGQEPNPQDRAINPEKVKLMFDKDLGEWRGPDDAIVPYLEYEEPTSTGVYTHGADWARKVDFTEIVTMRVDTRPIKIVAYERVRRLPWPVMVAKFKDRIKRYGGDAAHDGTGLGDVVDQTMLDERDIGEFAGRSDFLQLESIAEPVILAGRARQNCFSEYIKAIETDDIVCPFIEPLYIQHLYAGVDDIYLPGGHPPDGFVAAALAWRAFMHPRNPRASWIST
jgi:hypothetical protein